VKAVHSPEMSVTIYRIMDSHIPEYGNLHSHCREKFKLRKSSFRACVFNKNTLPIAYWSCLVDMLIKALLLLKNYDIVDYSETDCSRQSGVIPAQNSPRVGSGSKP
jgi:hypothetical protein